MKAKAEVKKMEGNKIKETLNNAVDKMTKMGKTVKAKTNKAKKWIKKHPTTTKISVATVTVAITAGVGYLLGKRKKG